MATTRQLRVGELIKAEVSRIVQTEVSDPQVGFVTITDVEVTPDLREAHVYVSSLGDDAARKQSVAALQRAARFIRGQLGRRIDLRVVPELTFALDTAPERATRVMELLQQIDEEKKERGEEPGEE